MTRRHTRASKSLVDQVEEFAQRRVNRAIAARDWALVARIKLWLGHFHLMHEDEQKAAEVEAQAAQAEADAEAAWQTEADKSSESEPTKEEGSE